MGRGSLVVTPDFEVVFFPGEDDAQLVYDLAAERLIPLVRELAAEFQADREIERVPIDALEGRVTSVLLTPYPPGIPLLIPGERFNPTIVRYLRFARDFNAAFPGFETDIHGLVKEEADGVAGYFVDCVR